MSLEERLAELTTALNRNSDLLEGLTAKAKAGVSAAAIDKSSKSDESKGDKGDDKPARGRKPKAEKAEKAPTVAEMKKEAETFLDVEAQDVYDERRAVVRAIADFFDAPKFTEIEAKDRLTAMKVLRMAAAGENVDPDDIQAAIDDLEGGSSDDDGDSKKGRRNDDV